MRTGWYSVTHLLGSTVGYPAVHLSCGWVVGVDVAPARPELPPDVVLEDHVGVGLRHDAPPMLRTDRQLDWRDLNPRLNRLQSKSSWDNYCLETVSS